MMDLDPKQLPPKMTDKQRQVLQALIRRNADGTLLDIQQLMQIAGGGSTRGAMLCTLRHLAAHKLVREDEIVTRRGRARRTYAATTAAYAIVRPRF